MSLLFPAEKIFAGLFVLTYYYWQSSNLLSKPGTEVNGLLGENGTRSDEPVSFRKDQIRRQERTPPRIDARRRNERHVLSGLLERTGPDGYRGGRRCCLRAGSH